jgi:CheY-like chemotaxis protein
VVFLTTSKERRDIEQAYRLGANAYLVKPTTPAQLREMVRAIRDFWIVHNTFL